MQGWKQKYQDAIHAWVAVCPQHNRVSCSALAAIIPEKSNALEQLDQEKQKKGEQLQQAHADLACQAALIKDMQSHAKKKNRKQAGVPAEQVCPIPHFNGHLAHLLDLNFVSTAQYNMQLTN